MDASMFYGTYLGGRLVFYHDMNGGGSVGAAGDGGRLVPTLAEPAEGWQGESNTPINDSGMGSGSGSADARATPISTVAESPVAESPVPQARATDANTAPSTADSTLAPAATATTNSNPNLHTRTTNHTPAPPPTAGSNPTYRTHSYTTNIPSPNTGSSGATFDANSRLTYNIVIPNPLPPSVIINPDSTGQAPAHNYTRRYDMRRDGIRAMTEIFGNAGRLARFRTGIMPTAAPITFENIEAATDANSTAVLIADDILRTFPTHYVPESTTTSSPNSASRPPFSTNRSQATPARSTSSSAGPSTKSSLIPRHRQLNPFVVHLCMLRTFGVPWRAIIRCNSTLKVNQRALIQYYYLVKRTRQPEWVCGSSRLGIDSFQKVLGRMPFSSPPLRYNQVRFICLVRFGLKFDWTWTMKYFRKAFPEDAACLATKDNDYLMVRVVMRLANERARVEAIFDGVGSWLSGDAEVPPEVFGWLAEFGEGRTVEMMRKEIMGGFFIFEADAQRQRYSIDTFCDPWRPTPLAPSSAQGGSASSTPASSDGIPSRSDTTYVLGTRTYRFLSRMSDIPNHSALIAERFTDHSSYTMQPEQVNTLFRGAENVPVGLSMSSPEYHYGAAAARRDWFLGGRIESDHSLPFTQGLPYSPHTSSTFAGSVPPIPPNQGPPQFRQVPPHSERNSSAPTGSVHPSPGLPTAPNQGPFMSGALRDTPPEPARDTSIRHQATHTNARLPYPPAQTRAAADNATTDPPANSPQLHW